MSTRHHLLFPALAAAMFALAPVAFAQNAPDTGGVPRDKLVGEYVDTLFDGDEVAAAETVDALRTGGDFSTTTTVTRQAINPDGTPATNPDGTPRMETITVTSLVDNPNGPMGWGEVDHSLGLAEALVEKGSYGSMEEALLGQQVITTVTNPDGTVTTTVTYGNGGLLAMRADGMGWGQVAKELGFKSLGEVKGNGQASGDTAAAKPVRAAKADTAREHGRPTAKPERVARVDRPQRPDKLDRPSRPERPERPAKPERPSRN
jgi:hypothetical protein